MAQPDATMPAAVYKGRRTVAVERVPVPTVGPRQVLMEISHCGICGSDLHLMMEDWGTPGSICGHEYSGVVVDVGSGVADWSAGDRAVGGPTRGCGGCDWCLAGRTNLCANKPKFGIDPFVGAFAGYKLVDADCLYRVPDGLDLRTAALTEPLAVARRGVRRAGPLTGRSVLVTGGGPIGQLTVAVLIADGITDITVSEPAERRQDLVRRIGAARVVRPDELSSPPLPMDVAEGAFAAAFECSGRAEAMEVALDNLDRAGTLVLSGAGMKRPRLDSNRIILNELVVTGTVEYTPDDYDAAIALLASGRLPVDALVERDDQPLDRLQWAMEQLSRGELAGKVMVAP